MNSKVIDLAVEAAKNAECHHKLGCVIFRKKTILSVAFNRSIGYFGKLHPKYQKYPGSLHAETTAIIKAKTELKNAELFVVRINRRGDFMKSLPCPWCMGYIVDVKIKTIYFSTSFGDIKKLKINNRIWENYNVERAMALD